MRIKRLFAIVSTVAVSFTLSFSAYAGIEDLLRLQQAYPEAIRFVSEETLNWVDGTEMPVQDGKPNKTPQEKLEHPSLFDQMNGIYYSTDIPTDPAKFNPPNDPGRIRFEPFFRKMYGNSKEEVMTKLTVIYWMPKVFGNRYPLAVTMINGVDKKLTQISGELETLVSVHPDYLIYLENPGGTFNWRFIANSDRLSPHSFGMTIDINPTFSSYWQWDLEDEGRPINEDAELTYRNKIPWEIVAVFEKNGFIWGGRWHHYDTMHFEYRPELLIH